MIIRAVALPGQRAAWLAFALAVLLFAAGGLYYGLALYSNPEPPFPSWADAGWLGCYPAAYAGLMLLMRGELRRRHASV